MIDLISLQSLIAVRDHGSVVAAARMLGFTPSAVSQQIKRLEHSGRQPMLERVGRGVVLTERGQLLADRGAELLGGLDALDTLVQSSYDVIAGTYRLATFATASRGLIAPLIARLNATTPALNVTVLEKDPREIVHLVARGLADAGLVHDWTAMHLDLPPEVETAQLLVDRADMIVHRDHPLAHYQRVSPLELAGERWAVTPAGTICHDWLLQMYALHGMRPDLRYHADDYATHVAMVAAGVAIALVPRMGRIDLPSTVIAIAVEDPVPERSVQLIWRRTASGSPARALVHRELMAIVANCGTVPHPDA